VVDAIRNFIATFQPDIILFAEMYRASQINTTDIHGPVLPEGYTGLCHQSIDRNTGEVVAYNAPNSSHEHECVAWRDSRLSLIPGSAKSVFGRNDEYGMQNCNYDFTAFGVDLLFEGKLNITAVAVHPDSEYTECRDYEIAEYWKTWGNNPNAIIGGDWNAGRNCYLFECFDTSSELQKPSNFLINYSVGQHWNLYNDTTAEPTAVYLDGAITRWLDN